MAARGPAAARLRLLTHCAGLPPWRRSAPVHHRSIMLSQLRSKHTPAMQRPSGSRVLPTPDSTPHTNGRGDCSPSAQFAPRVSRCLLTSSQWGLPPLRHAPGPRPATHPPPFSLLQGGSVPPNLALALPLPGCLAASSARAPRPCCGGRTRALPSGCPLRRPTHPPSSAPPRLYPHPPPAQHSKASALAWALLWALGRRRAIPPAWLPAAACPGPAPVNAGHLLPHLWCGSTMGL
jgi:hypothetical protein